MYIHIILYSLFLSIVLAVWKGCAFWLWLLMIYVLFHFLRFYNVDIAEMMGIVEQSKACEGLCPVSE